MAQLLAAFDAKQYNPEQGSGSFPVGRHPVVAVASEIKPTSNNDGGYLQYDLQIIDGPNKGVIGPYRLNLYNQSQKAVEIAHRQMSALCHVTGVFNVQDSSQLHNIPFMIEVGLQKGEDAIAKGYTEIKKVFDINGNEPGKAGQGVPAQQVQQPPAFTPVAAGVQTAPQQPVWGQQAPAPAQQQPQSAPAWGQPAQPAQQPAAQQAAWQQGVVPAGAAPWGQK